MPTKTLYVSRDVLVARKLSTGSNLGAGKDHHLGVGRISGYILASALRWSNDWDGVTQINASGSVLKLRVRSAHSSIGSNPRFYLRRITEDGWSAGTWGGQGGGDPLSETWSTSNATVYPGPAATTGSEIDTGGLGSLSSGDVVTIDITVFFERWAPSWVLDHNGDPGGDFDNEGLLLVSFDTGSTTRYIEFDSMEGNVTPYAILSYTSNAPPTKPVFTSPTNGSRIASTDPTIAFTVTDPDDTVIGNYDLVCDQVTPPAAAFAVVNQTTGISGLAVSRACPATLTRGKSYYLTAVARDPAGAISPYTTITFSVDDVATPTITNPGAGGRLFQLDYQAGWNTPRLVLGHGYSDPEGDPQSAFRWTIYDSDSSGANLGLAHQTAWIDGTATSYTVPLDLTNGGYYLVGVETKDSYGVASSSSALRVGRARWGRGAYYMDCGSAPSSWSFAATISGAGASGKVVIEYGSNSSTSAPASYKSSVGQVALARYFHYRVTIMAWGSASPTSPTLDQAVLTYQASSITPDGWVLGTGCSIDTAEFVYGSQSLKIDGGGTARFARQGRATDNKGVIEVTPNTDYRLSARVRTVGAANPRIFILDQSANVLEGTTALAGGEAEDWVVVSSPVWNSGDNTSVQVYAWMDGGAGTTSWFDALKLEASTVVTPWAPGFVGRGVAIDAGGVQIDGQGQAVFRLIPSQGSAHVVDLGAYGLVGSVYGLKEVASPGNPPAGYQYLFVKSADSKPYLRDNGGAETVLLTTNTAPVVKTPYLASGSPHTWTRPSGLVGILIEGQAAGGGSGGCAATGASTRSASGAGGGGGYFRKFLPLASIPATLTVTVGASGTAGTAGNNDGGQGGSVSVTGSSPAVSLSATGGDGGTGGGADASVINVGGGAGGTGSGGDVNIAGQAGSFGAIAGSTRIPGTGGSSVMGGGGRGGLGSVGAVGGNYGGGAGGSSSATDTAARAGAAGGPAVVVITEYYAVS